MVRIYSYVVRYDSGFAPNPFYGYCTLATCKPDVRRAAQVGDWVVGSASNNRSVKRGGHLVYAMRVTEAISFDVYANDKRFSSKRPFRMGSRKQSCGDDIYYRRTPNSHWSQINSFHSNEDGTIQPQHVARDTGVNRVLISNDFIAWWGRTKFPSNLRDRSGRSICKSGIGRSCFDDPKLIDALEQWIRSFGVSGYQGPPQEWISLRV